jgi:hypothetical protein
MRSSLAGVALASIILAAGMLAAGCAGSMDTLSPARSLLRLLPEDTSGVVFVNFSDLSSHAFVGDFVKENAGVQTPDELEEFSAATGFVFERDVRQLMAGSAPGVRSLVVVDAVYDLDRVVDYLTSEGMASDEYQGAPIFRPNVPNAPNVSSAAQEEARIALLGDLAVFGRDQEVRNAIDRFEGMLPSALDNPQLLADIEEVEDGYQVWATGRIEPGLIPDRVGTGGPMELISALQRGTYQMRFDDAITARAIGEFATAEQALTAASLLEGLRGMAMIQGAATEFTELLSGILIQSNDRQLEVQLQVDTAVLESLAESGALAR